MQKIDVFISYIHIMAKATVKKVSTAKAMSKTAKVMKAHEKGESKAVKKAEKKMGKKGGKMC